jgi:type II secretory pathway component PulF
MSFMIFPKILPVLKSLNVTLPITTQVFIGLSEFMFKYGVWVFLFLIAGFVGFLMAIRVPAIRLRWHHLLLDLPLIGRMSVYVNTVTIARTLNLLLRGGVKIVQGLEITSATLTNLVYRNKVREISQAVQRGETMSRSMIADEKLFPPTFSQMAAVGENTGKLDETLIFLADFYEGELDGATKSFSSVLEPVMLLLMGGVVVFVAISIITPIYSISQTLGR